MKSKLPTWVIVCIILLSIFVVLLPGVLNCAFIHGNIPTGDSLDNTNWLDFWGGYLSGIIGTAATLLALYVSYWQNKQALEESKRQYQQQRKEADEQYKKELTERQVLYEKERQDRNAEQQIQLRALQSQITEQARLDMMPVFEITAELVNFKIIPPHGTEVDIFIKNKSSFLMDKVSPMTIPKKLSTKNSETFYACPYITIRNIGNGAVLNSFLMIRDKDVPSDMNNISLRIDSLMPGEKHCFFFKDCNIVPALDHRKSYILILTYCDIFENVYGQNLEFISSCQNDQYELLVHSVSPPKKVK